MHLNKKAYRFVWLYQPHNPNARIDGNFDTIARSLESLDFGLFGVCGIPYV